MIVFFQKESLVFVVETTHQFDDAEQLKLSWLFSNAVILPNPQIEGVFIGPRKEMISPWSTNAVEITQNMGMTGIVRIEQFERILSSKPDKTAEECAKKQYDPMLQSVYVNPAQDVFAQTKSPEPIRYIDDFE